jgi:hypothetical protein
MAPNTEANHVEVLADPAAATTDTDNPPDHPNPFSLKWTIGEKWWHRSKFVAVTLASDSPCC